MTDITRLRGLRLTAQDCETLRAALEQIFDVLAERAPGSDRIEDAQLEASLAAAERLVEDAIFELARAAP